MVIFMDEKRGSGQPFEGLQHALETGRLATTGTAPRLRSYDPDYQDTGLADREARIRFGSRTAVPAIRRTKPRA
jgi:hypothetical protein